MRCKYPSCLTILKGLSEKDSKGYRSVVGLCLYAGREKARFDVYHKGELASYMSAPTLTSLARLRKMVGFIKSVGDIGLHLAIS